jgi:hypothetical protein
MMSRYREFDVKLGGPQDSRIVRARVQCMVCYKIIESHDRHDYKLCGCENQTMIDGGGEYERYGGIDMTKVHPLYEYVPAGTFLWGVLDRDTGETTKRQLSDLSDTHIQNIALHLRTRWLSIGAPAPHEAFRNGKWVEDQIILCDHFLPELEKRGLDEVTEEIPWD